MNATPNVNELAKKFWDLWQEQIATLMNDKDFVQTLLDMMQKSPFTLSTLKTQDSPYANPFTSAAPFGGDAASSHALMAAMDECAKRIGALERRIELLETAVINTSRKSDGIAKPARKRAAKSGVTRRAKKRGA